MSRFILAVLAALIIATPLAAADRSFEVTGWAAWVDPNSDGTFNTADDDFDVDFDGKLGYGAGVNIFFSDHLSTELSVVSVKSEATLTGRGRLVNVGAVDVDLIPITAVLQWHFAPSSTIDPYIGAGAAYVQFGDVDTPADADNIALGEIDADDLGLVINGGIGIALSKNFAIVGDIKYVPVGSSAKGELVNAAGQTTATIDINPVIFSAGLSLRF